MKITLDLSSQLIKGSVKTTKATTKTEVMTSALENITQQNKIVDIKKYKGKLNLKVDIDILRERITSIAR